MRHWIAILLLAFGLLGTARADERILDYFSDVKVEANGDLLVTETIRVRSESRDIRRGLRRDFPTSYENRDGTLTRTGFTLLGVRRNGADEPHATSSLANGVRIQIGSQDVLLDSGEYTYEIRYRTTRQIGFFADVDELYWNVTGSSWTFPIDRAGARITLPSAAPITQSASYTGVQGSRRNNARVTAQGPGTISFVTTAPLRPNEGLTVAAGWAKGVIAPPSQAQTAWYFVRDNLVYVVAVGGFVLLALYYVAAARKSRRRTTPLIVPRFEAPAGLSAPAVRFISRQRYDKRTFVVGVLELIATRNMRMEKTDKGLRFTRLGNADRSDLPPLLSTMLAKLFRKNETFLREDAAAGSRFTNAESQLQQTLEKDYEPLFAKNRSLAHRGLLLWFLYLAAGLASAYLRNPQSLGYLIMGLMFLVVPALVWTGIYGAWRRGNFSWRLLLLALFMLPFIAASMATLLNYAKPFVIGALPAILPLVLLPVVIRAYTFLRGYTDEGHRVMDEIAGFKQYLTLAESPRLQALATPEEKLGVFEECLPYAVALDVGRAWAAAFAGAFAGIAGMAAMDSMQQMYGGHDLLSGNPDRAVRDMSREVAPQAADHDSGSTSSSGGSGSWSSSGGSSSSSGSSGGGSSGGGGGGGGGSGW